MEALLIEGPSSLKGGVRISGSKNTALPYYFRLCYSITRLPLKMFPAFGTSKQPSNSLSRWERNLLGQRDRQIEMIPGFTRE